MAAELAVDQFLSLLERSRLLPEEQAQRLVDEFNESGSFDDSKKIADELVSREVLTSWQAGMLLQGKHRGFILGAYRILKPLGKGGMGAVFLAEHQRMRRRCAIKVLPSDHSKRESSLLDRFYREAQAVAALDHPNIVRAYDVNSSMENNKEIHYLVMEYVEGYDLQQTVQKRGVLGFREAADLIRQAAEGLAHAHQAGLVHRDIKPANLLLDSKGVVKVLDLGLAVFTETEDASLTNEMGDTVLGTADYLAPEQALDSHNIDARADIYSLGQTFYFLLVGHPPFPEGTVAQRLLAHQMKEPHPINATRPDAPLSLLSIVKKMIAKKPADRYQTAGDVAAALGEWLKGQSEGSGFLARQSRLGGDSRIGLRSPPEPTQPTSDHRVETDLELAPLDDEPKPRPSGLGMGSSAAKLPGSGTRLPGSGTRLPGSGAKLPRRKGDSQAGGSHDRLAASQSDALSASFPGPAAKPAKPSDVDDSEEGDEYRLSGEMPAAAPLGQESVEPAPAKSPLDDDLFSAPLPPAPPVKSGAHEIPRPKQAAKSAERSVYGLLFESGLFWIGLAVVLVLGLVIAIIATRPPARDAAPPSSVSLEDSTSPTEPDPPPAEPAAEPGKKSDAKPPPPKAAESSRPQQPSGRAGTKAKPKKPVGESPDPGKPDSPPGPPPTAPAEQPGAAKTADEAEPPAKPAARPPVENEPDKQALFAGVDKVSLELKSFDNAANSKLNLTLAREIDSALSRAGISTARQTDAAVLQIAMAAENDGQLVRLMLYGRLTCQIPNSEGVVVWEHQQEVASVAHAVLQASTVHQAIRSGMKDFFDNLVDARREAIEATAK
jgi:serine/threonine protein kinase